MKLIPLLLIYDGRINGINITLNCCNNDVPNVRDVIIILPDNSDSES